MNEALIRGRKHGMTDNVTIELLKFLKQIDKIQNASTEWYIR